jgi:hypothetical protein
MLFHDGKMRDNVMLTALTFQHGDAQTLQMPLPCLQGTTIMTVTSELVSIAPPTPCTLPVERTWLATHLRRTALEASELRGNFLLQKFLEHLGHPFDNDLVHPALDGLQDSLAFLSLSFPL